MSPKVERLSKEFALLTPQEKAEFLKQVTPSAHGEWIEIDGDIRFLPYDDEPWTEDDETAWAEGVKDIKKGCCKSWEQVKQELEL